MSLTQFKGQTRRSGLSLLQFKFNSAVLSPFFIFPVILVVQHFKCLPQLFLDSLYPPYTVFSSMKKAHYARAGRFIAQCIA